MNISRRSFLRAGAITCGSLGFNLASPFIMNRQLLASNVAPKKKLLFIFQRGGNDGINTVIPRGDSDYNTDTRPSLFIQEQQAIIESQREEIDELQAQMKEIKQTLIAMSSE